MYESPIEVILGELRLQEENSIYKAVQEARVNVDKDELVKALSYDRGQYKKGYSDGIFDFIKYLIESEGIGLLSNRTEHYICENDLYDYAKEILGG